MKQPLEHSVMMQTAERFNMQLGSSYDELINIGVFIYQAINGFNKIGDTGYSELLSRTGVFIDNFYIRLIVGEVELDDYFEEFDLQDIPRTPLICEIILSAIEAMYDQLKWMDNNG